MMEEGRRNLSRAQGAVTLDFLSIHIPGCLRFRLLDDNPLIGKGSFILYKLRKV